MAERYSGWHGKAGNVDASPAARNVAKQLLGDMRNAMHLGGVTTQVRRATLPTGETVTARFIGGIPRVEFTPPTGGQGEEDVVYLYVGSAEGLLIFDLGAKALVRKIATLANYSVQNVSEDGKIVHLISQYGLPARLSLVGEVLTAPFFIDLGHLHVATPTYDGSVAAKASWISPDQKTIVHAFSIFGHGTSAPTMVADDGMSGYLVCDAKTMLRVRNDPIRMTYTRPRSVAWAPDSSRFFIATMGNADNGASQDFLALQESNDQYIVEFSRTGVLGATRLTHTTVTATGGFFPDNYALTVNPAGTRLYFYKRTRTVTFGIANAALYAINITDPALPIVATYLVGTDFASTPFALNVTPDGKTLFALQAGGNYVEYTLFDQFGADVFARVAKVLNPDANAVTSVDNDSTRAVQYGPKSKTGSALGTYRFLLDSTTKKFSGFINFHKEGIAKKPIFTFDTTRWSLDSFGRYALAYRGRRLTRKKA